MKRYGLKLHRRRLERDESSQLSRVSPHHYYRPETAMLKACQLVLVFLKTALSCNGDGAFCSCLGLSCLFEASQVAFYKVHLSWLSQCGLLQLEHPTDDYRP